MKYYYLQPLLKKVAKKRTFCFGNNNKCGKNHVIWVYYFVPQKVNFFSGDDEKNGGLTDSQTLWHGQNMEKL
jgi:hypothetical protein